MSKRTFIYFGLLVIVLAAVIPARSATRVDILRAIAADG